MDAQRAEEICLAKEMAHVMYDGEYVYIEHVDKDKGLATIHPLSNPHHKQSVSVEELIEH